MTQCVRSRAGRHTGTRGLGYWSCPPEDWLGTEETGLEFMLKAKGGGSQTDHRRWCRGVMAGGIWACLEGWGGLWKEDGEARENVLAGRRRGKP